MIQLSTKIVKAKKVHSCDLCFQKIQVGTNYRYQFNKFDGEAYAFKNHIHCEKIAEEMKMYDECDEGLTGEIFDETIREEYIRLMEIHNSDVFNYEHFQFPSFNDRLKYVCEMHKVEFLIP